jgi:hypothetical protein
MHVGLGSLNRTNKSTKTFFSDSLGCCKTAGHQVGLASPAGRAQVNPLLAPCAARCRAPPAETPAHNTMAASEIKSVALIEYDTNDDVMLTWTYPGVSPEQQQLLIARAEMTDETNVPFSFGKYKGDWHYIYTVDVEPDSEVLQDVQSVSLCVLATAFNPEKYYALLKILASEYLVNGEAVYIMQNILKCITKGSCGPKDDTWEFSKFINKHAYLANCSLKKIVKKFGLHSILLWAATMLRKRVVVLGPDWESVFVIVRALPQFVWHRQNWDILWPQVRCVRSCSMHASAPAAVGSFCALPCVRARVRTAAASVRWPVSFSCGGGGGRGGGGGGGGGGQRNSHTLTATTSTTTTQRRRRR